MRLRREPGIVRLPFTIALQGFCGSLTAFTAAELRDIFTVKLHTDGCQTRKDTGFTGDPTLTPR